MTARRTVPTTTSSASTTSTSSSDVVVDLPADAQLVALGIGQDHERPEVAGPGRVADHRRAQPHEPLDQQLGSAGVEVEVDPILRSLLLGHALEEHDRTITVDRRQVEVRVAVALGPHVAEGGLPERRQRERIEAVDADLYPGTRHTRSLRCNHFNASRADNGDSSPCVATNATTASASVFEYSRSAHPMALRTKNSRSPARREQ